MGCAAMWEYIDLALVQRNDVYRGFYVGCILLGCCDSVHTLCSLRGMPLHIGHILLGCQGFSTD